LANGRREPAMLGMQDTVSQFVQLTWLFATRVTPPQAGSTVELPLALPQNASVWVFDVQEPQRLATPFGEIDTWHVVPRRKAHLGRSVLLAETWLAPAYRYLPVRIRITQASTDEAAQATYLDLTITQPPEWAQERPPPSP
jgi:hypothetical protein